MPKYKETCCVNTIRNSQNFLNKRNWPNSVPMLISRRTLRKDNSSLHLMMMHSTTWKDHVERKLCIEVRNPPTWEGGSVETRRSTQSWMWRSVIIKDVTVWKSWSNLYFVTERFVENRCTGKPVAKAKPRPTPTLTLSPVSIPYREPKWIDVQPWKFSERCFEVSKFMIRLLRHDEYSSSRRWWSCVELTTWQNCSS